MVRCCVIRRTLMCGALAGLLAVATACGDSSSPTSPSQGAGIDYTIDIKNNAFAPNPLTMRVGQVVNWHNLDAIEHSATLDGMFDTGRIPPGSARNAPVTMSRAGSFTFHCTVHAGETGTIVVN